MCLHAAPVQAACVYMQHMCDVFACTTCAGTIGAYVAGGTSRQAMLVGIDLMPCRTLQ